jgi:catalase-peroxidase
VIEDQGLGWRSKHGTGHGADAITGGLEVTWSQTPTKWSNYFFENLFKYEWELTKSPAGALQWKAKDAEAVIPDAYDPSKKRLPTMLTSDLALRVDPAYEKISRRFHENPDQFADAFARAWFKLTHRDMGPIQRYLGPLVPKEPLIWQDPYPGGRSPRDRRSGDRGAEGPDPRQRPVGVAAGLDRLGLRLDLPLLGQARRRQRRAHPAGAAEGLGGEQSGGARDGAADAGGVQKFNASAQGGKKVSLADLIVLGGSAAMEQAAKEAGSAINGAVHTGSHGRLAGADRR